MNDTYVLNNSYDFSVFEDLIDTFELPFHGWINSFDVPTDKLSLALEMAKSNNLSIDPILPEKLDNRLSSLALEIHAENYCEIQKIKNFVEHLID